MRGVDARRSWLQYESIFIEIALLRSSSLRGDDLHTVDTTDQVPGVGGGRAPRCYPQTLSPARSRQARHKGGRARQLVARLRRRIQHDTQYIQQVQSSHGILAGSPPPGSALYETHSRTRVGGWVLRSGPRRPGPRSVLLGGGRDRPKILPRPRAIERDRLAAPKARETAEPDETLPPDYKPPDPLQITFAGRPGATRVRPRSPPLPPGPDPPSTRAVLAAPLSVTRDTRKGRDARARRRRRPPPLQTSGETHLKTHLKRMRSSKTSHMWWGGGVGLGQFPIVFGSVSYQIRILMYPDVSCIMRVSCKIHVS